MYTVGHILRWALNGLKFKHNLFKKICSNVSIRYDHQGFEEGQSLKHHCIKLHYMFYIFDHKTEHLNIISLTNDDW